jgi:hypothetical protein
MLIEQHVNDSCNIAVFQTLVMLVINFTRLRNKLLSKMNHVEILVP